MIKKLLYSVLDTLFPPYCLKCKKGIDRAHSFCASCFSSFQFTSKHCCRFCGYPLPIEEKIQTCIKCLERAPLYEKNRAPLVYNDASREVILQLKHCDQLHLAKPLGQWMLPHLLSFGPIDSIIPIPLHHKRLIKRRYNQATLLAKALVRFYFKETTQKIPIYYQCLTRKKNTESQGGKSYRSRHENVRAAFEIANPSLIKGKRVCLIDDVYTTGATIKECTQVLLKSGAQEVYVLTAARVVMPAKEKETLI